MLAACMAVSVWRSPARCTAPYRWGAYCEKYLVVALGARSRMPPAPAAVQRVVQRVVRSAAAAAGGQRRSRWPGRWRHRNHRTLFALHDLSGGAQAGKLTCEQQQQRGQMRERCGTPHLHRRSKLSRVSEECA